MRTDTRYLGQLFFGNRNARLIDCRVQISLTTKARGRGRRPNVVEHRLIAVQRMTCPVAANQVEHAMLNRVPFGGSGRIMVDRDNQA